MKLKNYLLLIFLCIATRLNAQRPWTTIAPSFLDPTALGAGATATATANAAAAINNQEVYSLGFWLRITERPAFQNNPFEIIRFNENAGSGTENGRTFRILILYYYQEFNRRIDFQFGDQSNARNTLSFDPFDLDDQQWFYFWASCDTEGTTRTYANIYDPRLGSDVGTPAESSYSINGVLSSRIDPASSADFELAVSDVAYAGYSNFNGRIKDLVVIGNYYAEYEYRYHTRYGLSAIKLFDYDFHENAGQTTDPVTTGNSAQLGYSNDATGFGNVGNDPNWSTTNDEGLVFAGNDVIVIDDPPVDFLDPTDQFGDIDDPFRFVITFSFWIKLTEVPDCDAFIFNRFNDQDQDAPEETKLGIYIQQDTNVLGLIFNDRKFSANVALTLNTWTFLTITCNQYIDRPTQLCYVYYDYDLNNDIQIEELSYNFTGVYSEEATDKIEIGNKNCSFTGHLRTFEIYRGAGSVLFNELTELEEVELQLGLVDPLDTSRFYLKRGVDDTCTPAAGEYLSQFRFCARCELRCDECSTGDNNCDVCTAGFFEYEDECICDDRDHYYDIDSATCANRECGGNCETCDGPNPDDCLTCNFPYHFWEGQCIEICENGLYAHVDNSRTPIIRECRECDSSCYTCNGPDRTDCTSCFEEMYFFEGVCSEQCPHVGFYEEPVTKACRHCAENCETCSGPGETECLSCLAGTFLYDHQCLTTCPDGSYNDVDSKKCISCHSTCKTCFDLSQISCLSCPDGLYLQGAECVQRCEIFNIHQYENDENNQCTDCHISCYTCDGGTEKDCTQCDFRGFLYEGQCLTDCPDGYFGNTVSRECEACDNTCKDCNGITATDCIQCYDETFLTTGGECLATCPDTFYPEEDINECMPCDPNCFNCSGPEFDECTECVPGSLLDGTCLPNCPLNYYVDGDNVCQQCHPECQECTGDGQNECTSCEPPRYLFENSCVYFCPTNYEIQGQTCQKIGCPELCEFCGGVPTVCTECVGVAFLQDGDCVLSCSPGYYPDFENRQCLPCSMFCDNCIGPLSTQCTSCPEGQGLLEEPFGQCTGWCSSNEIYTDLNLDCSSCHPSCQTCQNFTSNGCTSCEEGYYLTDDPAGECLPEIVIPEEYFERLAYYNDKLKYGPISDVKAPFLLTMFTIAWALLFFITNIIDSEYVKDITPRAIVFSILKFEDPNRLPTFEERRKVSQRLQKTNSRSNINPNQGGQFSYPPSISQHGGAPPRSHNNQGFMNKVLNKSPSEMEPDNRSDNDDSRVENDQSSYPLNIDNSYEQVHIRSRNNINNNPTNQSTHIMQNMTHIDDTESESSYYPSRQVTNNNLENHVKFEEPIPEEKESISPQKEGYDNELNPQTMKTVSGIIKKAAKQRQSIAGEPDSNYYPGMQRNLEMLAGRDQDEDESNQTESQVENTNQNIAPQPQYDFENYQGDAQSEDFHQPPEADRYVKDGNFEMYNAPILDLSKIRTRDDDDEFKLGYWEYVADDLKHHHSFINLFAYQSIFSPSWLRVQMLVFNVISQGAIIGLILRKSNLDDLPYDYTYGSFRYIFIIPAVFCTMIATLIIARFLHASQNDAYKWKKVNDTNFEAEYHAYIRKRTIKAIIFTIFLIILAGFSYYYCLIYEVSAGTDIFKKWIKAWVAAIAFDLVGLGVIPTLFFGFVATFKCCKCLRGLEYAFFGVRAFRSLRIH